MEAKKYFVSYTSQAEKSLAKMDPRQRSIILAWIDERLEGCTNPRKWGKGLRGERSQEWSYRVGKYRILADIIDNKVIIEVFKIGLRGKVYKH
jgi:mRNA interferase RelE/StbE